MSPGILDFFSHPQWLEKDLGHIIPPSLVFHIIGIKLPFFMMLSTVENCFPFFFMSNII